MDLSKFAFLTSTRFWVMVIGCLGIAAEGNFTFEAWGRAVIAFATGFITVRTVDRTVDRIGDKKVEAAEAGV